MRIEYDFIGEKSIPPKALYGIHSIRAKENFPDQTPFHIEWYKATAIVKKACYLTYKNFKQAILQKYKDNKSQINLIDDKIIEAMIIASDEIIQGNHFEHFIVPAIQGGAGTSINMNINEIITNLSLIQLGYKIGEYNIIDPIEHANIYQSTNDVIPTALRIALMKLFVDLENSINILRNTIEQNENKYRNTLRIAYTQMQEAVPSTYGKLFAGYNDALSRDWWRVSKCFERIKLTNIGGGAAGTGLSIPRFFIMEVINQLQKLTDLPLSRAENLTDATANLDSFVEVSAILKSHAVNLEKIVSDIRLIASDINKPKEISIPQKQVGSSIMPGKINPIITEYVVSVCQKVYSNDNIVTNLSAAGCLDLNAYLPLIGHSLIESIKLLISANKTINDNLFSNIEIDETVAKEKLFKSPSVTTALTPYIGYNKSSLIAKKMKTDNISVFKANDELRLINSEKLKSIMSLNKLNSLGFVIDDLLE